MNLNIHITMLYAVVHSSMIDRSCLLVMWISGVGTGGVEGELGGHGFLAVWVCPPPPSQKHRALYTCILYVTKFNLYAGSGGFSGLTSDGKIAVASSVAAFFVGSVLFFITGFLCGHYCRKEKRAMVPAASQCGKTITHGTTYYDDVVLNQQQELELKENVAYAPVR